METRVVVGWRERVALPDWGVESLVAKVDTGALTSALHVEGIRELGERQIGFDVVLSLRQRHRHIPVVTEWVRRARVRSSNGEVAERYVVRTRLRMGPVEREIELNLSSRERMHARMLIGRTALGDQFLVDASRRYLVGGLEA